MIVGILSDSHGRGDITAAAIRVLREAGAEVFIHCGDIGGGGVLEQLAGLSAWFVWGNTDDPGPLLTGYVQSLGLPLPAEKPLKLILAGRVIVVFHGHEPGFRELADMALAGRVTALSAMTNGADYVLFGHTHIPFDERLGAARVINPGALHRTSTPSVATLDLHTDQVHFWRVKDTEVTEPPQLLELPYTADS
ncbi:MAG: metallophosphoesterase family protein [Planctomycetota bacterium]